MANLSSIAMLAEVNGVLPVDKPLGLSAHDIMKAVKTHFNLVKVGHGGTLDPNATGLFPLLLGDATRISNDLMARDRAYTGVFTLGRATNTGCRDGETLAARDYASVTRETLEAALPEFRGDLYQRAPAFNVVKIPQHVGYDIIADEDERPERMVHVYRFAITDFAPPRVSFSLATTKGVSVRALVDDLGRALGCGACVEELRRVKCGALDIADAISFADLIKLDAVSFKARVLPVGKAFA